ncbi:MAG TPA: hypothetical protein VFF93_01595, partial [Luteimonas sp.]|nr:hypothetical protein [Luteimonas sp.]
MPALSRRAPRDADSEPQWRKRPSPRRFEIAGLDIARWGALFPQTRHAMLVAHLDGGGVVDLLPQVATGH